MHPRLLEYYEQELAHLRDSAAEFAGAHPRIAGRLGVDGAGECADPYVERLLEGFAFMAARVRLKVDAEFPRFTEDLLALAYPSFQSPVPSALVIACRPDEGNVALAGGFRIPSGARLRSEVPAGEATACTFTLCHPVTLYPLAIVESQYLASPGAVAALGGAPALGDARSGVRIRIRATAGLPLSKLDVAELPVYLPLRDGHGVRLFEALTRAPRGLWVRDASESRTYGLQLGGGVVEAIGYSEAEALFPGGPASFSGYRLLREFLALPERFLFVRLGGLECLRECPASVVDLVYLCGEVASPPVEAVRDDAVVPFAAPAVNRFERTTDRMDISTSQFEYPVYADRMRRLDYEILDVRGVTGYHENGSETCDFVPVYRTASVGSHGQEAYFSVHRRPRLQSSRQRRDGTRSPYVGTDTFITLCDPRYPPFDDDLRQIALRVVCSNRDLPLLLRFSSSGFDLRFESGAPVVGISVLAGPSVPRAPNLEGDTAWAAVNHFSLNYGSLSDPEGQQEGAVALRRLLNLYADLSDPRQKRLVDALRGIRSRPVVRRVVRRNMPLPVEGLQVEVTCDEAGFTGLSPYLFGCVLERFLAQYAGVNGFTETVLRGLGGIEVMRWKARSGLRPIL